MGVESSSRAAPCTQRPEQAHACMHMLKDTLAETQAYCRVQLVLYARSWQLIARRTEIRSRRVVATAALVAVLGLATAAGVVWADHASGACCFDAYLVCRCMEVTAK